MVYDRKNIILGNLSRISREQTHLIERREAHIGELADFLCDEAGEDEIFFRDRGFREADRKLVSDAGCVCSGYAAETGKESTEKTGRALSAYMRASLCRRLTDGLDIRGVQAAGTYFDEISTLEDDTVSYMRSSYADEAFARFSEYMTDPKAIYGYDFSEVCDNVYYERSEYCILPIENTTDGRLAGFRRLMMKYGLKTVMLTRVEDPQETGATVFALLKRCITVPSHGKKKFLEIRVTAHDIQALLCAADGCGMKLSAITAVPDSPDGYDLVFTVSEEGICGFLSYLLLEYDDITVTGFAGMI